MEAKCQELKNYMKEKPRYESIEHIVVSACDVTGLKFSRYSVMEKNQRNTLRKPFQGKKIICEYNVFRGEHFILRENKNTCGDNKKPTVVC